MNKSAKIFLGFFLLLVLVLTYLEASEPNPVNWSPSYLETDKIALGGYVFYDSWKEASPANFQQIELPPFEFLNEEVNGTYFFLNDQLGFDEAELKKLLEWVNEGNTLFLSANNFSENLLDSLQIETSTRFPGENFSSMPFLNLVNPQVKKSKPYQYEHETPLVYFSRFDTLNQAVLGVADITTFEEPMEAYPVFLKSNWGKGTVFIHSMPQAFSNFFLLTNSNYSYAEGALAYLNSGNNQNIFLDGYYKTGKSSYSSPLYILLNNKPLKWVYYFMLAGSILFIIFEGKRKQRAVPVVTPLKNQTYEYSKTIADLYLEQKQYKSLALKKIEHFYDYIRIHYRIDTSNSTEKFLKELASKSNNTEEDTHQLFDKFKEISTKAEISKNELQELNDSIESFKQQK